MLTRDLRDAIAAALTRNGFSLPASSAGEPPIEVPRILDHGDYATNLALQIAKEAKLSPREVAQRIATALAEDARWETVEVAGPGFINVRLAQSTLGEALADALDAGPAWGQWPKRATPPILVEYVSANPTGPMNVVNARAGAVGAALVRLFRAAGFRADGEFYVNDAGRQVDLLGLSVEARFQERIGEPARFPEDGYQGAYLVDVAAAVPEAEGRAALGRGDTAYFRGFALERMLASQERDLGAYGVHFDRWSRESELHAAGALADALATLEARGHVFLEDGAKWFRSTSFGDEKDRVLVRQNGEPSYFLADIAYHKAKHDRRYGTALDLWGPDHHGHIARMKGALVALGLPEGFLEVEIVQFVRLLSKGELVKMSKRAGEFVTLTDLLEDVGPDCAKFFFLMRSTSSHLDFDLDLAKEQSSENPAYYVQYAHARVASLVRVAAEKGVAMPENRAATLAAAGLLASPAERALLRLIAHFPEVVKGAAEAREPHRVTTFLSQTAAAFHQFYHDHRVVTDDAALSTARLALARGVQQTIANGLALLGVSAPERM